MTASPSHSLPDSDSQTLRVTLPREPRDYPIYIETGLLEHLAPYFLSCFQPKKHRFLLVCDSHVAPLYRAKVQLSLEQAGFTVFEFILPPGEEQKSWKGLQTLVFRAIELGLTRNDCWIALGGGVIGDLVGFAAATYHRGAPLVQIPTTLLAQVDSSVGGKVAINLEPPSGLVKNSLGNFYQPQMVLIDPKTLGTLPERQIQAGLAEVVKYACIEFSITGKDLFFAYLRAHAPRVSSQYPTLIETCCRLKALVVSQDEQEQSDRRILLNLGHTFAHAYESLADEASNATTIKPAEQPLLLHGEAVAVGMLDAFRLSVQLELIGASALEAVLDLYHRLELPTQLPNHLLAVAKPKTVLAHMAHDKKNHGKKRRLVLPTQRLGQVQVLENITDAQILEVLEWGLG